MVGLDAAKSSYTERVRAAYNPAIEARLEVTNSKAQSPPPTTLMADE